MNTLIPAEIYLDVARRFNWRLFLIIWAASLVGVIAVIPYALTLQGPTLANATSAPPLPLLLAAQIGENAIVIAVVAGAGLWLASRVGLGLPFIEGWLKGQPLWRTLPRVALIACLAGVGSGAVLIVIDALAFGPALQAELTRFGVHLPQSINPPAWQGLLASFEGGITEEVELRLLVMTGLAWLGRLVGRTSDNRPTVLVLWLANLVAAILFGLAHLPTTAAIGIPLTTLVVVRAVVLNGIVGVIAGWLYSRWGLESAMICHFSADLVLHVVVPLIVVFVD